MIQENDVDIDSFIADTQETERNEKQEGTSKGFKTPKGLGIGQKAIVRFVNGIPSTPTDPGVPGSGRAKLVNIAWIQDDNNKPLKLILPALIDNKPQYPSIIHEFVEKVTSRTWVDFTEEEKAKNVGTKFEGKDGRYVDFYENRNDYGVLESQRDSLLAQGKPTLRDIYLNVKKSGHKPGEMYYESQKSWSGQTCYVGNVIDRLDNWCSENKHTKLLVASVKVKGDKVNNKEASWFRMSPLKEFAKDHGSKMNYDVLIVPNYKDGKEASNQPYQFFNISKLKSIDYFSDVKRYCTEKELIASKDDLNDEGIVKCTPTFSASEQEYDVYDIDKEYRFTTATTLVNHCIKTIEAFDAMQGTDFGARLRQEAALEKQAKDAAKAGQKVEDAASPIAPIADVTAPIATPTQTVAPTAPVAPTAQVTEPAPVTTAGPIVDPVAPVSVAAPTVNVDGFYADLD